MATIALRHGNGGRTRAEASDVFCVNQAYAALDAFHRSVRQRRRRPTRQSVYSRVVVLWLNGLRWYHQSMNIEPQEWATVAQQHETQRGGKRNRGCWLAFAAVILAWPAVAQTVVDGDTIKLKGTTYQLYGIDAAEKEQACADGWAAGRAAIIHLHNLMQDGEVACEAVAKDRFGPGLAVCTVDGEDLGAAMVAAGMAWAFLRHASEYIDEEAQANIDRLGVHNHGCMRAWDWRALQRRR
jgi:endonuclease YncB( thermonuclease family)